MTGSISNMCWVPEDHCSEALLSELMIKPKRRRTVAMEPSEADPNILVEVWRLEPEEEPVKTYRNREINGVRQVGLPIDFGVRHCSDVVDETAEAWCVKYKKCPDPTHPNAPPNQAQFFNDCYNALEDEYSVLAIAPTGTGKTVAAMYNAAKLGVKMLVVVPSQRLAKQWVKEAKLHLGLDDTDIALISGKKVEYEGCHVAVVVIHNLVQKQWSEHFTSYFGLVVWDECHRVAANTFSDTLTMFNSGYKLSVTATDKRADGMEALIYNYFGRPKVVAKSAPLPTTCFMLEFKLVGVPAWIPRCRNDVKPMKWLTGLPSRNEVICDTIIRMHKDGRQIVVLSRFIDHLEVLIDRCIAKGLDPKVIGQYSGKVRGKKPKEDYYEWVKSEAEVIFGSYSSMKEGVDIPRLDAGIEASPVANNVQGIGRIRRAMTGKRKPVWISICDNGIKVLEGYTTKRLTGFRKANVKIKKLRV